jgi:hypothetical protein
MNVKVAVEKRFTIQQHISRDKILMEYNEENKLKNKKKILQKFIGEQQEARSCDLL